MSTMESATLPRKNELLKCRCTAEEKSQVESDAAKAGMKTSEWMRHRLLGSPSSAREQIKEVVEKAAEPVATTPKPTGWNQATDLR